MEPDKFISARLDELLNDKKYSDKLDLILSIKNGNNVKAKYQLFTLLSESHIDSITIENLRKKIKYIFCSDSSIEDYLNKIVYFNPILSYISISTSSGKDMDDEYTLDIKIPVPFDNNTDIYIKTADNIMKYKI